MTGVGKTQRVLVSSALGSRLRGIKDDSGRKPGDDEYLQTAALHGSGALA